MGGSQTWFENAKPISRAYCFRTRCRRGRSFCVRYKKEMFLKDSGGSRGIFAKIVKDLRIGSLVGRAPALHAGGHRFESCPVHHLIRHFARSAFFLSFLILFLRRKHRDGISFLPCGLVRSHVLLRGSCRDCISGKTNNTPLDVVVF